MPEHPSTTRSNDVYRPIASADARHRQAILVWMVILSIVGLWTTATISPPVFRAINVEGVATPLYGYFSYICHQIEDRSFFLFGHQLGVCSRCFGVYSGLLIGVAVYPLWRALDIVEPIPRFWLFLSLIPISIDWSLTAFHIWENTQASRFITGFILGFACATFIVPAVVEITRNFGPRIVHT